MILDRSSAFSTYLASLELATVACQRTAKADELSVQANQFFQSAQLLEDLLAASSAEERDAFRESLEADLPSTKSARLPAPRWGDQYRDKDPTTRLRSSGSPSLEADGFDLSPLALVRLEEAISKQHHFRLDAEESLLQRTFSELQRQHTDVLVPLLESMASPGLDVHPQRLQNEFSAALLRIWEMISEGVEQRVSAAQLSDVDLPS
ncbi:MAG: hypothetical protein AAF191_01560 [Verrucomicrobiota bacterium]